MPSLGGLRVFFLEASLVRCGEFRGGLLPVYQTLNAFLSLRIKNIATLRLKPAKKRFFYRNSWVESCDVFIS